MNDTPKSAFFDIPSQESCIKTLDDLRGAISHIHPIDHDFSVKIGMAVNDEFGEEARDIWMDWALGREKATRAKVTASWKSFRRNGGVTIATVVAEAKASGWQPNGHQSAPFTPEQQAEREAHKAQLNAIAAEEAQMDVAAKAKAAEKAAREWHGATEPDLGHPYAKAKQIKPYGARQLKDGRLIIPLRNKVGEICSSQTINSSGVKKYEKSGAKAGAHSLIGEFDGADTVLLCEGWATGCSLHEATNYPVVVCLDSGNLSKISKNLPNVIPPLAHLVICGDRDKSEAGQKAAASALTGLTKIGRRAVVSLPVFSGANDSLTDFNDLAASDGIGVVRQQINAAIASLTALEPVPEEEPMQTEPATYGGWGKLADFNESCDFSNEDDIIEGIFPRTGMAAVYGASGCGKTFFMIWLAAKMGMSPREGELPVKWCKRDVIPRKVVYLTLEAPEGFKKRCAAFRQENREYPIENFKTLSPMGFSLLDDRDVTALISMIREDGGADVIIIDTLSKAIAGADENSAEAATKAIASLERIQRTFKGLVIVVHHTGKDPTKEMRGSSAIPGALDTTIKIESKGGNLKQWTVKKNKDGDGSLSGTFKLESVRIGTTQRGKPITSLVAVESLVPVKEFKPLPKAGSAADVVLKVLTKLAKTSHAGRVNHDDLVDACKPKFPEAEYSRPAQRIRDGIKALRAKELIDGDGQKYWLLGIEKTSYVPEEKQG